MFDRELLLADINNIIWALKQIDKLTDSRLLPQYPEVDWKKAKGMRDIITHHYFDIDAETIYTVCREHVPAMVVVMTKILSDLQKGLPHPLEPDWMCH